ncbi:MAG: F0F1 ATP synthase subunit delta [Puniceicoccales bacterium]|jgi:F0F1-type ATP synthase delta subunit|nr:F0F1 ATP synthase subunit delta [Puniceicoccales bacterium]
MQKRTNDALIKNLVALSFDGNHRLSFARARAVITVLSEFIDRKTVLARYFKLLEKAFKDNTLIIEYAGTCDEKEIDKIKCAVDAIKGRKVDLIARENQQLIAGVKILLGDEVYDNSVRMRLNSLR